MYWLGEDILFSGVSIYHYRRVPLYNMQTIQWLKCSAVYNIILYHDLWLIHFLYCCRKCNRQRLFLCQLQDYWHRKLRHQLPAGWLQRQWNKGWVIEALWLAAGEHTLAQLWVSSTYIAIGTVQWSACLHQLNDWQNVHWTCWQVVLFYVHNPYQCTLSLLGRENVTATHHQSM